MSLESSYQHHPWHIEHHTLNIVMPLDPQLERDFLEAFGFGSTGGGGGGGGEAGAVASSAILSYRSGLVPEGGGVLSSSSSSGEAGGSSLLTMRLLGGGGGGVRGGLSLGTIGSDFMMAGSGGGFGGSSSSSASAPSRNWAKPHELLAMQRLRRLQAPNVHVGGTDGGTNNGFEGLLPSARWIECGMPLHLPTEWSVPQAPPLVPPPPPPAHGASRMERNGGGGRDDEDPFEHVLRGAAPRT